MFYCSDSRQGGGANVPQRAFYHQQPHLSDHRQKPELVWSHGGVQQQKFETGKCCRRARAVHPERAREPRPNAHVDRPLQRRRERPGEPLLLRFSVSATFSKICFCFRMGFTTGGRTTVTRCSAAGLRTTPVVHVFTWTRTGSGRPPNVRRSSEEPSVTDRTVSMGQRRKHTEQRRTSTITYRSLIQLDDN